MSQVLFLLYGNMLMGSFILYVVAHTLLRCWCGNFLQEKIVYTSSLKTVHSLQPESVATFSLRVHDVPSNNQLCQGYLEHFIIIWSCSMVNLFLCFLTKENEDRIISYNLNNQSTKFSSHHIKCFKCVFLI